MVVRMRVGVRMHIVVRVIMFVVVLVVVHVRVPAGCAPGCALAHVRVDLHRLYRAAVVKPKPTPASKEVEPLPVVDQPPRHEHKPRAARVATTAPHVDAHVISPHR